MTKVTRKPKTPARKAGQTTSAIRNDSTALIAAYDVLRAVDHMTKRHTVPMELVGAAYMARKEVSATRKALGLELVDAMGQGRFSLSWLGDARDDENDYWRLVSELVSMYRAVWATPNTMNILGALEWNE